MFADCDLVLVEGDSMTDGYKVEVWRAALDTPPMAADDATIAAVVTDDDPGVDAPVWERSDLAAVAKSLRAALAI